MLHGVSQEIAACKGVNMSDLVLRELSFDSGDVTFDWHPGNPPFSLMLEAVTLQVGGESRRAALMLRNPERGHVPDYYGAWQNRYECGKDMTMEHNLARLAAAT